MQDRAKHHGWMDANGGITGNLSNHEGDLDPVDEAIKDCLIDKEQLESEKELRKDLSKELNAKEGDIIQGQLSKDAKESRKNNTLKYKMSTTTSSSNTPSTLVQKMIVYMINKELESSGLIRLIATENIFTRRKLIFS
jgi:hypothetical protein